MIFARRFFSKLAPDSDASISDLGVARWSMRDVDPNIRLVVDGEVNAQLSLATVTSVTLDLPDDYVNTDYLFCQFQTEGVMKVTVTNPDSSTSVVLVSGTSDTPGIYSFTQKVTSIVINNPTATTITIGYQLIIMPPLDESTSFRGGAQTFGMYQP